MIQHELPISQVPDEDDHLGALLGRARQGSAAAFDQLATRVHDRVRRWAGQLTRDADDADDVAQLVLLRLHVRLREFEGRSRFTTWLYRMTRNVALSRRRVDQRRAGLLKSASHGESTTVMPHDATRSDVERMAELIRSYAKELSGREREVFELVDLRGMSSVDIAKSFGVEPVTVRVSLLRARRRIRLRMLEQHPELLEEYES